MTYSSKPSFSRRAPDHLTDELVIALSETTTYGFNELFLVVYARLKLKKAVSGGEEMLRLRCYEKLQRLASRGLVLKTGKTYGGLKGLELESSVHKLARADAAVAARFAATS